MKRQGLNPSCRPSPKPRICSGRRITIVANGMTAEGFVACPPPQGIRGGACRNQSLLVPQPSRYEKQHRLNGMNVPRPSDPWRSERQDRGSRFDFGPPPGYQPIVLPGESISKYQRLAQSQPAAASRAPQVELHRQIEDPPAPLWPAPFPRMSRFRKAATVQTTGASAVFRRIRSYSRTLSRPGTGSRGDFTR